MPTPAAHPVPGPLLSADASLVHSYPLSLESSSVSGQGDGTVPSSATGTPRLSLSDDLVIAAQHGAPAEMAAQSGVHMQHLTVVLDKQRDAADDQQCIKPDMQLT